MNFINQIPVVDILRVGLSGLCFLLAVLSYRLIGREQSRSGQPRSSILRAIYVFMCSNILSAALCAISGYFDAPAVSAQTRVVENADYVVNYTNYLVDLTSWTPETFGPVFVTRTDHIRKNTDKDVDYVIPYYTTGDSIKCEPLSYSTQPSFKKKTSATLKGTHYDYRLKVGHQPLGYTEVISSKFTFLTGFKNPKSEWWEASVAYPAKTIVVTIRFPNNKPCKSIEVSRIEGIKEPQIIQDNIAIRSENNPIVSWVGLEESGNARIHFDWSW